MSFLFRHNNASSKKASKERSQSKNLSTLYIHAVHKKLKSLNLQHKKKPRQFTAI